MFSKFLKILFLIQVKIKFYFLSDYINIPKLTEFHNKPKNKFISQSFKTLIAMKAFLIFLSVVCMLFNVCYTISEPNNYYYCQPSDRHVRACPLYVMEMCAWYYKEVCEGTVTIGGTCARAGTNSCVDCQDAKVERVSIGKCPQ